jgi:hypothetical protein
MILFYILGGLLMLGLMFIAGEATCSYLPNNRFSKWWRKYVVEECQECD